jgi:hypothetical protein
VGQEDKTPGGILRCDLRETEIQMNIVFDILIGLSMLAVVGSFFAGMIAFAQNGREAEAKSNRMMSWRVRTQVIAIAVLMISMWYKSQHPGL